MEENDELREERSEDLVARIRGYVDEAAQVGSSDPEEAMRLEQRARELLDRLWGRHYEDAKRAACRYFGTGDDIYQDAVAESSRELSRILLCPGGSLRGLDRMFSASFKCVCLDGIERVDKLHADRRTNRTVSLDLRARDECGEEGETLGDALADPTSLEQFASVIGHEAYSAIAPLIPAKQRAVLEMRLQNKQFQEIAETLGIHKETASAYFEKAVRFIENKLNERSQGER